MTIEFFGTLSEQCQKDISKRTRKKLAIMFTVITVLLGIVPTIVTGVLKDEYFGEFLGLTILCAIFTIIYWLPITVTRKPPQGVSTDVLIRIDDTFIRRSGYGGVQVKPLSKVSKVIDAGEWYYVIFKLGDVSTAFVCQKDLITTGTLEDFETLFADKIVRQAL